MAVDEVVIRAILRDELSRPLAHVRGEVERLDKQMISTRRATAGLSREASGLRLNLGSATSSVNRMSMSLAQFTGRGIQTASFGLAGLGAAAVGFGLKSAASFESSRIAFGTLLGSVERGNDLFAQLQKFNLQTPFGLNDISSATQTLLQFGFTADNVMSTLKGISDVAALTDDPGSNLSRIAVALGQISGAGVLRAQDLNQLVQAGFPAYQLLQDITGQTAQEIRKQMETGLELPASKFIAAVQNQQGVLAKYAGGAAAQAHTLRGIWSNFTDMLRVRLATAMQPLADRLQTMLPQFSDSLGLFIDHAAPALSRIALSLLDMLTRGLPAAEPLITGVLDAIGQMLTSPVMGQIGVSLANFVTEFVPHIPELIDAFLQLALVLPPLIALLAQALPAVTPVAKAATAGANAGIPKSTDHHGAGYYFRLATAVPGSLMGVVDSLGSQAWDKITGDIPSPFEWINQSIYGKPPPPSTPSPARNRMAPSSMGSSTQVNIHDGAIRVTNPASNVDVATAVQQGIAAHEASKQRRQ